MKYIHSKKIIEKKLVHVQYHALKSFKRKCNEKLEYYKVLVKKKLKKKLNESTL